ncbi:MAG TPA: radical SAM protein [Stellaceae bacterium]|nr:radical SAM protein [Stellaceae bacterium]
MDSGVAARAREFRVILIKPSHYDDDGYVIQWRRSGIPSNSLASVYGLIQECAEARALGPEVEITLEAYDECNTVIDVAAAVKRIRDAGGGMIGLVGVQSNQYPRALDLGRQFRKAGLPVVIGGFHVSGCISMLEQMPPELVEAQNLGIVLYAGEAEGGRMADLLRDVDRGEAKPIYNYLTDLPDLDAATFPILPRDIVTRVVGHYASFDAGRGCPFQCSFCTIINVQGRKSRYRTADDVEAIVRENAKRKITHFFVTDDNFARNRNWEAILDRLIEMRQQGFKIRLLLQVDTLCHRTPGFIEKCAKAGCYIVFIGLENINPESLLGTKKRQNKIWEYREMLQAWKNAHVMTWAGYITGFPTDTPQTIARDIEIIKKELPIDILEFFFLTPLPGSEDHKVLHSRGVPMDPDLNKYDLEHYTTAHARMSREEWEGIYRDVWKIYYSDAHVETILRRAVATGLRARRVVDALVAFAGALRIEGVHPLQLGLVRRKIRTQRRPELERENPLLFYPRWWLDFTVAAVRWGLLYLRFHRILRRVLKDPNGKAYTDTALQPTAAGEVDHVVETYADLIKPTYGAPKHAEKVQA